MDKEKQAFEEFCRPILYGPHRKEHEVKHDFHYFNGGYHARDAEIEQTRQQLFRAVKEVGEMGAEISRLKAELIEIQEIYTKCSNQRAAYKAEIETYKLRVQAGIEQQELLEADIERVRKFYHIKLTGILGGIGNVIETSKWQASTKKLRGMLNAVYADTTHALTTHDKEKECRKRNRNLK